MEPSLATQPEKAPEDTGVSEEEADQGTLFDLSAEAIRLQVRIKNHEHVQKRLQNGIISASQAIRKIPSGMWISVVKLMEKQNLSSGFRGLLESYCILSGVKVGLGSARKVFVAPSLLSRLSTLQSGSPLIRNSMFKRIAPFLLSDAFEKDVAASPHLPCQQCLQALRQWLQAYAEFSAEDIGDELTENRRKLSDLKAKLKKFQVQDSTQPVSHTAQRAELRRSRVELPHTPPAGLSRKSQGMAQRVSPSRALGALGRSPQSQSRTNLGRVSSATALPATYQQKTAHRVPKELTCALNFSPPTRTSVPQCSTQKRVPPYSYGARGMALSASDTTFLRQHAVPVPAPARPSVPRNSPKPQQKKAATRTSFRLVGTNNLEQAPSSGNISPVSPVPRRNLASEAHRELVRVVRTAITSLSPGPNNRIPSGRRDREKQK